MITDGRGSIRTTPDTGRVPVAVTGDKEAEKHKLSLYAKARSGKPPCFGVGLEPFAMPRRPQLPAFVDVALARASLHDWSTSRVAVAAIDRDERVLRMANAIGPSASHYAIDHFEPHPRYFLEGDPSLLDAPGEWHLDRDSGRLTYKPKEGETLADVTAVAPYAQKLVKVRGRPDARVTNLRFEGLTFAHCAWPLPPGGYAAGQASFHERRDGSDGGSARKMIPAAVSFRLAERCRVVDARLAHLGGTALWFGTRTDGCRLLRSTVTDVAANGVMLGETRARRVDGEPWWKAAPEQASSGHVVRNCLVERCGRLYFGAVGLWVGLADGATVAHNEIRRLPYTGVSVGWMWNPTPTPCKNHRVVRNHIHHVMRKLSDGGGIYTLGRQPGTVLRGNRIHSIEKEHGRAESNGMFLDQGTTQLTIERNAIYDVARSPLRFHQAEENLVRANLLVVPEDTPVVRYNATDAEKIHLRNNRIRSADEWGRSAIPKPAQSAGIEE